MVSDRSPDRGNLPADEPAHEPERPELDLHGRNLVALGRAAAAAGDAGAARNLLTAAAGSADLAVVGEAMAAMGAVHDTDDDAVVVAERMERRRRQRLRKQ